VTGIDNLAKEQTLPPREEFFDAVRRHICQILGFDVGFIDLVSGHEIATVVSFATEENNAEVKAIIDALVDEHKQPLTLANTHLAQKVKQTQKPWVGRSFSKDPKRDRIGHDEGYPYAVVPILAGEPGQTRQVKGLIRIISFDASREIGDKDLATLQLIGEHLSGRLPQSGRSAETPLPEQNQEVAADAEPVLIVHSNRPVRRRFSRILGSRYKVLEADNTDKALEVLGQNSIDLVILDSEVQGMSGYSFCKVLKEAPQWKSIPVIIITPESNPAARIEGLNVGADDCLSESCFDPELLARVSSSLRHRKSEREQAVQLQLLEDYAQRLEQETEQRLKEKHLATEQSILANSLRIDADRLRNQEHLLHRTSNTIRRSFNIKENLTLMVEELAGFLNLDCCFVVLPATPDGTDNMIRCEYTSEEDYSVRNSDIDLKILETFKEHFDSQDSLIVKDVASDRRLDPFRGGALANLPVLSLFVVPITYIAPSNDEKSADEEKLLGVLGGLRFVSPAIWTSDNENFFNSVADQVAIGIINARLYQKIQRQATTDGLTALFNHRTGQEKLAEGLRSAERYQRNLAVIMFDVDHFKSINDKHGHPAGDSVLKAVAKLIQRDCRDVDLPVRYGGEEFLLILPEINSEGAVVVAERIRKNLAQEVIVHGDIEIRVSASMGVAAFPEDAQNQQHLLDLADKALYLSKRLGRNQVHTAQDLMYEEITPQPPPPSIASTAEVAEKIKTQPEALPPTLAPQVEEVAPATEEREELVPEVVEMVKALATALYSKSDYNKIHHLETARMAELLARVMGLSQQEVEQIRVAGLLHDVGTLSIPSDLLEKQGRFTAEERRIINQHPVLGAELLRPIRALKDICQILENHHERWDGTGYPRGLKGEDIPLSARIVSIVDSYHAMISDRPYRPAMTPDQAMEALRGGAGSQWDPFLVDIFLAVLNSLKQSASAEPNVTA
jgi:diguanylate cyclase (GGDEF)-like protein/putative nucleotidyltransferase with HDIG domain